MRKSPPPGFLGISYFMYILISLIIFEIIVIQFTAEHHLGTMIVSLCSLLIMFSICILILSKTILHFQYDDEKIEFKFITGCKTYRFPELTKISFSHFPISRGILSMRIQTSKSTRYYEYYCPFYSFSRLDAMEYLIRHLQNLEGYDFELKLGPGLASSGNTLIN